MNSTEKLTIKVAILDLYEGYANQGMRCIREILNQFGDYNNLNIDVDEFDVRLKKEAAHGREVGQAGDAGLLARRGACAARPRRDPEARTGQCRKRLRTRRAAGHRRAGGAGPEDSGRSSQEHQRPSCETGRVGPALPAVDGRERQLWRRAVPRHQGRRVHGRAPQVEA